MFEKANDRCLAVLEELELEIRRLNKEINYLKDLVNELMIENKEYREMEIRFRSYIEKHEKSLEV